LDIFFVSVEKVNWQIYFYLYEIGICKLNGQKREK